MAFKVKVISIDRNAEDEGPNGSYTYTLLKTEYQGKVSDRRIFAKHLKKYPNLDAELDALTPGMEVDIEIVKNGKFSEISKISKASSGSSDGGQSKGISGDAKQESIVFQNSMSHATAISIHNAGKNKIRIEDVLSLAHKIAIVSLNPSQHKDIAPTEEKTDDEDQYNYSPGLTDSEDIPF